MWPVFCCKPVCDGLSSVKFFNSQVRCPWSPAGPTLMDTQFGSKKHLTRQLPSFATFSVLITCLLAYFERTRTPLTSFIHSFRFSIMFFSSAMLKPVSFCSWSTYVNAGLPLFLAPCFGSQSSRSLITSSFFLQQCPINRSLLLISVSVILGRLPYSSRFEIYFKKGFYYSP